MKTKFSNNKQRFRWPYGTHIPDAKKIYVKAPRGWRFVDGGILFIRDASFYVFSGPMRIKRVP